MSNLSESIVSRLREAKKNKAIIVQWIEWFWDSEMADEDNQGAIFHDWQDISDIFYRKENVVSFKGINDTTILLVLDARNGESGAEPGEGGYFSTSEQRAELEDHIKTLFSAPGSKGWNQLEYGFIPNKGDYPEYSEKIKIESITIELKEQKEEVKDWIPRGTPEFIAAARKEDSRVDPHDEETWPDEIWGWYNSSYFNIWLSIKFNIDLVDIQYTIGDWE